MLILSKSKFLQTQKVYLGLFIVMICFCNGCKDKPAEVSVTTPIESSKVVAEVSSVDTDIPIYDFEALEPLLHTTTDTTYIINFWAMWCAPCVKELPYFQEYADKNPDVEMMLVSLDFPKDIETKMKPFLKKRNITLKTVLLDDPDANSWINKISDSWSGAIPFTIIFNNKKRAFYERSFENLEDLENVIHKTINNNI